MSRKVFGFGETVYDIIFKDGKPLAAKPGGSVLNSFVSLGRLGWNPFFISEYARDGVGDLIDAFLIENGVDTRFVNRYSGGKSALALAFLDEHNNARYSFYRDFPRQRLQVLPDEISGRDIVVFGSIYASNAEVRDAVLRFLETAKNAGALILYDPNFRKAHLPELEELRPRILENLEYADIIRGSDEDFRLIFGIKEPEEILSIRNIESKILIYTKNSKGVLSFHRSGKQAFSSENISPISTIGAGDNFNAGLIHNLLEQGIYRKDLHTVGSKEIKGMVEKGIRFASHVCLHYDNYISREFASKVKDG